MHQQNITEYAEPHFMVYEVSGDAYPDGALIVGRVHVTKYIGEGVPFVGTIKRIKRINLDKIPLFHHFLRTTLVTMCCGQAYADGSIKMGWTMD